MNKLLSLIGFVHTLTDFYQQGIDEGRFQTGKFLRLMQLALIVQLL